MWWIGRKEDNVVDMEGPPDIDLKQNEVEGRFVKLRLVGAQPENNRLVVKFLESEWPIIKARVDAAFAGQDPNQSEFYQQGQGSGKDQG